MKLETKLMQNYAKYFLLVCKQSLSLGSMLHMAWTSWSPTCSTALQLTLTMFMSRGR